MYTFHASRNDFIEIMFQKKHIYPDRFQDQKVHINKGEILICWKNFEKPMQNDENIPSIIVINDDEVKDFLAWATTFFPGYNPLSMYFRVLCLSDFENIIEQHGRDFEWNRQVNKVRAQDKSSTVVWDALIGMVIGETYSLAYMNKNSPIRLTPFNCTTCFSFLLARCIACGYGKTVWLESFKRWQELRTFFGLRLSPLTLDNISFISNIIESLIENTDLGSISCNIYQVNKLIKLGFSSNDALNFFDSNFSKNIASSKIISLPKEDRFRLVNEYINTQPYTDFKDAFSIAYLINLISPGSFEQKDMLNNFSDPSFLMLLYGLCAGLSGDKKIRESFNYLGNRVFRDISRQEDYFSSPKCDCSYTELMALYENKNIFFKSNQYSRVIIEIFPNIEIIMSNNAQEIKPSVQEVLPGISSHELDIKTVYNYLDSIISDAIEMRHYISGEDIGLDLSKKRKSKRRKKDDNI